MSQGKQPLVLVVEADSSLRRIITLGLQHRGMQVIEASPSAETIPFDQQPDLVLLDIDNGVRPDWPLLDAARTHPRFAQLPIVVLTWECPEPSWPSTQAQGMTTTLQRVMYVPKPFDARTLHEVIEQLLKARAMQAAANESREEANLLAASAAPPAPSAWPLIAAAGLLLIFAGLLLQVAVVVCGLLILMAAVLLWMTEAKPRPLTANP